MTNQNKTPNAIPAILTAQHPIAYFSAEYAIENNLPIYAGGLGVLSADTVLEAATENIPMVAFGIMYTYGFEAHGENQQRIDPQAAGFELLCDSPGHALTVDVVVRDRIVKVQAWQRYYGAVRLLLLDTDHPANTEEDRSIAGRLYDPDFSKKATQEWVFGAGSIAFLRLLEIEPSIYHLNEGHMGFVAMALILEYIKSHPGSTAAQAQAAIKNQVVSSKHTFLAGAGLFVDRLVLKSIIGSAVQAFGADYDELFDMTISQAHRDHFSGTKFILDCAVRVNGVSELHVKVEKAEHPESRLIAITNGIHKPRWIARNLEGAELTSFSDEMLWKKHTENRGNLIATINDSQGTQLDPNALTVVWARRITPYKRPALLFNDIERLSALVNNPQLPVQIIIAGKANAGDPEAKSILEEILKYCEFPKLKGRVVYMPGYSVPTTKQLTAGADLWLNTPIRGQEACGTSGMKASLNGALQYSTSDGWVDEVSEEFIGWKLREENIQAELYSTLEQTIAPLYYDRDDTGVPTEWVKRMRQTMQLIDERFTAGRMLDDYLHKLYFPQ